MVVVLPRFRLIWPMGAVNRFKIFLHRLYLLEYHAVDAVLVGLAWLGLISVNLGW